MKVLKPFFLGSLIGLALSFALLLGLYFSPMREFVYFQADPEIADLRSKLHKYRDWLAQADLYIVEKGAESSDSLQTAQSLAWREYKKWRNHLGELARLHDQPSAEGVVLWTYSLRYWVLPTSIFLILAPALLWGWRARNRFRPSRSLPRASRKGGGRKGFTEGNSGAQGKTEALTSFQDALKKIAQISDAERKPAAIQPKGEVQELPPTALLEILPQAKLEVQPQIEVISQRVKDPETKPLPLFTDSDPNISNPVRRSVWSESNKPDTSASSGLSMEDEDGEGDAEIGRGILHPTTELERVERRKDQVLKLARKGLTSSEISRRMRISQDQVEFIIRLRREKG